MTQAQDATAISVPPRRDRVARSLAGDVRDRVVSGELPPGAFLGRERELMERYRVSRASLREALRMLESEGFVRVRRGPGGGVFAQRPSDAAIAEAMGAHLRMRGASAAHVADVHRMLVSLRGLAPYRGNPALELFCDMLATLGEQPAPDPEPRGAVAA